MVLPGLGRRPTRGLVRLGVAFCAVMTIAGKAQAMTLTSGADPVESVPTQIAVSGIATGGNPGYRVIVTVKTAGGARGR
jgi:hypothetical protein